MHENDSRRRARRNIRLMRLHLKIRSDADASERDLLMRRIEDEADAVERLFPDQEGDLSDLYSITVTDDKATEIIGSLQDSAVVDWVEKEPERHLIW